MKSWRKFQQNLAGWEIKQHIRKWVAVTRQSSSKLTSSQWQQCFPSVHFEGKLEILSLAEEVKYLWGHGEEFALLKSGAQPGAELNLDRGTLAVGQRIWEMNRGFIEHAGKKKYIYIYICRAIFLLQYMIRGGEKRKKKSLKLVWSSLSHPFGTSWKINTCVYEASLPMKGQRGETFQAGGALWGRSRGLYTSN